MTNSTDMKNTANAIAKRINRVVSRWNSENIASRFNSCVEMELEDFNFENETTKGLFRTIIALEFANMSNYRKVFPIVEYK